MPPRTVRSSAPAVVTAALLLAGCTFTGPPPSAAGSPSPAVPILTSPAATAIPTQAPPTATPSLTPLETPAPSTAATCSAPIPAGDNLVLGAVSGSAAIVLRDITDLANPRTLCTFSGLVSPQFASASVVGFAEGGATPAASGDIVRLDLAAHTQRTVASWPSGGFGSGIFDWSPDGQSLTYLAPAASGLVWHLLSGDGSDRVLAALGNVPNRGVSQQDDDFKVAFSQDGLYLSLVETYTSGSGDTAPLQVRRASDGALVYSGSGATMGVWASVPSRLFFRNSDGVLSRWDPSTGVSTMQPSLKWTRPRSSPDGRWVAYTIYDGRGYPRVGLYGVQSNTYQLITTQLRSGAQFLNTSLVWYQGEALCGGNPCGLAATQPSGVTYLYDIGAATENVSRIKSIYDAWPRVSTGHGF